MKHGIFKALKLVMVMTMNVKMGTIFKPGILDLLVYGRRDLQLGGGRSLGPNLYLQIG